jgi:small ligand-binding sensory domain FIST
VGKLRQILAALGPEERAMVLRGLHLGVAMNEYAETHERGGFLIRGVLPTRNGIRLRPPGHLPAAS